METKSIQEITTVVLRAVTLAMGVAVVVLSCLNAITADTAIVLLGIGLTCAGAAMMGKQ